MIRVLTHAETSFGRSDLRVRPPHQDPRMFVRTLWARPIFVGAGLFVFGRKSL